MEVDRMEETHMPDPGFLNSKPAPNPYSWTRTNPETGELEHYPDPDTDPDPHGYNAENNPYRELGYIGKLKPAPGPVYARLSETDENALREKARDLNDIDPCTLNERRGAHRRVYETAQEISDEKREPL
jgi:hypothetical protein